MSNYPPYPMQPYGPQIGPCMAPQPFQNRPDVNMTQAQQGAQNAPQSPIAGLSAASRSVASREEAMGVAVDFSGARMLFPDIAHNRVYVKWWDFNRGEPIFQEYAPVIQAPAVTEQPPQTAPTWVSLQDFQDLQDIVEQLRGEIDRLKKPTGKAAVKNDADK